MYWDKSDADSERVSNFPDFLFVPIKKFKDLDKVIYGNNGNVYIIRGYLSVAKNAQPQPDNDQKGEKALIYKFDFKKMESKIVYVFEEDIWQFTWQRFKNLPALFNDCFSHVVHNKSLQHWLSCDTRRIYFKRF